MTSTGEAADGVVGVVPVGVVPVGASAVLPSSLLLHAASPSANTVAKHSVIKFFCVTIFEALLLRRSGPETRPSLHFI